MDIAACRAEAELATRLLLQRRGRERRTRPFRLRLRLDGLDRELGVAEAGSQCDGVLLVDECDVGTLGELARGRHEVAAGGEALAVDRDEGGGELGVVGRERALHVPVGGGPERHPLPLPLDHQPGGDALHAPGRAGAAGPAPGHERHLVAEEAVEDPAALVRLDELHVEVAPVLDGLLDRRPGDLVEDHPLDRHVLGRLQQLEDVPRDRLALAVLIRGEIELAGVAQRLLEGADVVLLLVGDHPHGLEVVVDVDPETAHVLVLDALRHFLRAARQVAHVPVARDDPHLVATEEAFDGLRLRGRLDDHEWLRHSSCFIDTTRGVIEAKVWRVDTTDTRHTGDHQDSHVVDG